MIKAVKYAVLPLLLLHSAAKAQEQRWFEVEMLVFSQTPAGALQERFDDTVTPIKPGRAFDLLTPRFQPDLTALLNALAPCQNSQQLLADDTFALTIQSSLCINEAQPHSWQQLHLFDSQRYYTKVPYPAYIPALISGSGEHKSTPYLAEQDSLQLTEIANKLKRLPGKQLLLHTSWRQAPVTERRAIASRWYAGSNFSQQFDYWGKPLLPAAGVETVSSAPPLALSDSAVMQKPVLEEINQLLAQLNANPQLPPPGSSESVGQVSDNFVLRSLPDQVWQLDGLFKLHLDHYLFVNTEFNLRVPQAGELQTVYVKQSRRVISGEIHYLDHPYLGIVLQIRRFEPPQAPEPEAEAVVSDPIQ